MRISRGEDMRKVPTAEERWRILSLFRTNSVNHVVFLMNYKFDGDDVNKVIRDRITELEAEVERLDEGPSTP